jgi:hypothetical protein
MIYEVMANREKRAIDMVNVALKLGRTEDIDNNPYSADSPVLLLETHQLNDEIIDVEEAHA